MAEDHPKQSESNSAAYQPASGHSAHVLEDLRSQRRSALHLAVSDTCNNSCRFCLNGRVDGRIDGAPVRQPTREEIRQALEEGYHRFGLRELAITIAEPTVGPHLVDAIRYARELGFERINMNTNGRRLAHDSLIDRLLEAGLTNLILSIHGPTAEVHDALVGRAGAFAQVVRGLDRLAELRPAFPMRMSFLCVLNALNLPHLAEMYRFFSRYSEPIRGDKLSYTCLKLLGSAVTGCDDLIVPYQEIAAEWLRVWRDLGTPAEVLLSEIPTCAVVAQSGGDKPIPPVDIPDSRFVRDESADGSEGESVRTGRDANYVKRPECGRCLFDTVCGGVMTKYVERYGWREFPPVERMPNIFGERAQSEKQQQTLELTTAKGLGELVEYLTGLSPARLAQLRLEPTLASWRGETLAVSLAGPQEFLLGLHIAQRNESGPVFVRTRHLDLYYTTTTEYDFVTAIMRRMAKRLATTRVGELRTLWERLLLSAE